MNIRITKVFSAVVLVAAASFPVAAAEPEATLEALVRRDTLPHSRGQIALAAPRRTRPVQHPTPPLAPPAIEAAARKGAEAAMKAGAPAVQIAVSEGGRIIYSGAFGVTDQESETAATPRSVVQIASVTKQFTAAAILRLAERGVLSLDDPIGKFVPEFDTKGATITLRQLLSHTSGVRNAWFPFNGTPFPANPYTPVTREQVITSLNKYPLDSTPGTKFSYSNAGYMLAGYALESASGKSLAEFVHTEFALPLGLLDTGLCGTSNLPLPAGYSVNSGKAFPNPALDPSMFYSAGALCSTAADLARWSYHLASGQVLLPSTYATMTTQAALASNSVAPYGLGLQLPTMFGRKAVWHTGAIEGFQSSLINFTNEGIAVAVIINVLPAPPSISAHFIASEVAKAALGV